MIQVSPDVQAFIVSALILSLTFLALAFAPEQGDDE
jgi:hypothetical protein